MSLLYTAIFMEKPNFVLNIIANIGCEVAGRGLCG